MRAGGGLAGGARSTYDYPRYQEDMIMNLILPEGYDPHLTIRQTQEAIKYIRDTFQKEFGKEMNLERISAPLIRCI